MTMKAASLALRCFAMAIMLAVGTTKRIHSFAGPFIAYADKWYKCQPGDWDHMVDMNIRHSHFNRMTPNVLQKLSGNVTLTEDLGDDYWLNARLDTWSNNQWKENAFLFKFPTKGCSVLRQNIPDFFRVAFHQDISKTTPKCVIPKGLHIIENDAVNWTFPSFPVMPYGHYRFYFRMGQPRKPLARMCTVIECFVVPSLQ